MTEFWTPFFGMVSAVLVVAIPAYFMDRKNKREAEIAAQAREDEAERKIEERIRLQEAKMAEQVAHAAEVAKAAKKEATEKVEAVERKFHDFAQSTTTWMAMAEKDGFDPLTRPGRLE